jgi:transposase
MHYVGIDWADTSHQVAIVTAAGHCISETNIAHTSEGFNQLCEHLRVLSPVQVNIERPDGLLVDRLIEQGIAVYVTPPRIAAHRRPRSSKDDRGDARLLANLLRIGDEECRLVQRHGATVETLRQLLQAYEQLQRQQIRTANQLRQVLKQYYPVLLHLFSDVSKNIALVFLQTYPDPRAARCLTYQQVEDFLRGQSYRHMQRLDTIYQHLQKPSLGAAVWEGMSLHAQALIPVLQVLNGQLAQLKRAIWDTFVQHPEAGWWQLIPGAGELTAPRLLAEIGDNRAAFPDATTLQARAGTVPVTRRSGKSQVVHFRVACDKALRKALMDLARNSLPVCGWAKSYYADQLARGHDKNRAMRALANRWARIVWTLWVRREPYDELRHVANRSRKGLAAAVS